MLALRFPSARAFSGHHSACVLYDLHDQARFVMGHGREDLCCKILLVKYLPTTFSAVMEPLLVWWLDWSGGSPPPRKSCESPAVRANRAQLPSDIRKGRRIPCYSALSGSHQSRQPVIHSQGLLAWKR